MQRPFLLSGNKATDVRGSVSFINNFDFTGIKRFYIIENSDTTIIRAFHGHMKEGKYVTVIDGRALICSVPLDNPTSPSKDAKVKQTILSSDNPQILSIPPGYANGIRSLDKSAKILIFSTSTLTESIHDDFRFPYDYWGKDVWRIYE